MRKTALILAAFIILTVCLSSCETETAYETYYNAYTKTAVLNDVDMTLSGEYMVTVAGITYTIPLTANIKAAKDSEGNPVLDITATYTSMNFEITAKCVYSDGWIYIDIFGQKYKKRIVYNEISAAFADINAITVCESNFENVEFINKNGKKTAAINIPGDSMKGINLEYINKAMEFAGEESIEKDDLADLTINDLLYTFSINKDGYIDEHNVMFTMDVKLDSGEDEKVDYSIDFNNTYVLNNIEEPISVSAPENTDEYIDFDSYMDISDYLE